MVSKILVTREPWTADGAGSTLPSGAPQGSVRCLLRLESMRVKKLAIAAPGRFHAFDLGRELRRLGHEVYVYSNYPRRVAERFGLDPKTYRGLISQRVFDRLASRLGIPQVLVEAPGLRWFSAFVARGLQRDGPFDAVYLFSGAALDALSLPPQHLGVRLVARGSSHIDHQFELLDLEARQAQVALETPSRFIRERERLEYAHCDHVVVNSTFGLQSFRAHGVSNVQLNLSGCDPALFKAGPAVLAARQDRIRRGQRLKILLVGSISYRKGVRDALRVAEALHRDFDFEWVGEYEPAVAPLRARLEQVCNVRPRVAHFSLPEVYQAGDLYLFPTLEDGFPATLAQALWSGLPVLTTPRSSALDLISEGLNGHLYEPSRPQDAIALLQALNHDRPRWAAMVEAAAATRLRTWEEMARGLLGLIDACVQARASPLRASSHG